MTGVDSAKIARYQAEGKLVEYIWRRLSCFPANEWDDELFFLAPYLELSEPEKRLLAQRLDDIRRQRKEVVLRRQREELQRQEELRRWEDERRQRREEMRQARKERQRQTDPHCPYRTLKTAYADGWHDAQPDEYGGEKLLLKGHRLTRNGKRAMSRTAWERQGYRVRKGELPHAEVSGCHSRWAVYRDDQVELVNQDLLEILDGPPAGQR